MKTFILFALLVVGGNLASAQQSYIIIDGKEGYLVPWYDCSTKEDGNYQHPYLCTHFMACVANKYAYEMDCATNHDGHLLHYGVIQDDCLYPEDANCVPLNSTTTTEAPPSTHQPEPTHEPEPENPNECNPLNCTVVGWCNTYSWCKPIDNWETPEWIGEWQENVECGDDLWWNPDANSEHGGTCDLWTNLSEEVRKAYKEDDDCISRCKFEAADCAPAYNYTEVINGEKHTQELSCSDGLVWHTDERTCVWTYCHPKCPDFDEGNENC